MGVTVVDGTLREGDQAAGVWLRGDEKAEIFRLLDAAGVGLVDAGMPAVSEEERDLLRALAESPGRRARVYASVRCRPDEVALAADCGVDGVFVIFPVSSRHRRRIGVDGPTWRHAGETAATAAREAGLDLSLVFEDASRADEEELAEALDLAAAVGAASVMLCDTVGILTPSRAGRLVASARDRVGSRLALGVHFHNDFGMATANTVAAVEAGADLPSVTVNGVGERAGNAPLAEVAAACRLLLGVDCRIDLRALVSLSARVEALTGVFLGQAAPLVGHRTFDHESGIHVHGILQDPATYEGVDPAVLGRRRRFLFGKHTGRAGLAAWAIDRGLSAAGPGFEVALARLRAERPAEQGVRIEALLEARARYLEGVGVDPTSLFSVGRS